MGSLFLAFLHLHLGLSSAVCSRPCLQAPWHSDSVEVELLSGGLTRTAGCWLLINRFPALGTASSPTGQETPGQPALGQGQAPVLAPSCSPREPGPGPAAGGGRSPGSGARPQGGVPRGRARQAPGTPAASSTLRSPQLCCHGSRRDARLCSCCPGFGKELCLAPGDEGGDQGRCE